MVIVLYYKKIVLFYLFIILLSSSVFAIGISPSRNVLYYEPGLEESVSFYVVNNIARTIGAEVYSEGEFSYLLNLQNQSFNLAPGEKKEFEVLFTHPSSLDIPGDYTIKIHADELPEEDVSGGTFLSAVASVISPLILRVPYEGAYLSASLNAESVSSGQYVPFILRLENLGDVPIPGMNIAIYIFDSENMQVGKIEYQGQLELNEIKKSEVYWDSTGMGAGTYTAKLEIKYIDKTFETSTKFKLGEIFIDIVDVQNELTAEKINEYYATVTSKWSDSIEGVFVQLSIQSIDDTYNFKGTTFNLDPWGSEKTLLYVDLDRPPAQISEGEYPATFTVFYEGFSNTKNFDIMIKEPGFFDKISPILVIGFSIMGIIIAALILYIIKLNKGKK